MTRIRRNQYALELVEFLVIGTVIGVLLAVLSFVSDPTATNLDFAIGIPVAGGFYAFIVWAYSALTRLLWVSLDGCLWWIAILLISGLITGAIVMVILDLNARIVVSRLYTGDEPLVYAVILDASVEDEATH